MILWLNLLFFGLNLIRFTHFLTVLVLRLSRKCDHPAFSLCLQSRARREPFAGPALAGALAVALQVTIRQPRAGRAAAPRPLSNGRATARGALPSGKMLSCDDNMFQSIKISVCCKACHV